METSAWIYALLLGLGLAASCGLNTFLPLLMLAAAAHFQLFGIELNQHFAWVASNTALIALSIGTLAEVIADKIPAVDHALDVFGTVARPAAGTLAAASVAQGDASTAALLGLIIGVPTALGMHTAKAGTRAASSATTLGFGNPLLSLVEDIAAVVMTLIAFLLPLLVPVFLILAFLMLRKIYKSVRRHLPVQTATIKRTLKPSRG